MLSTSEPVSDIGPSCPIQQVTPKLSMRSMQTPRQCQKSVVKGDVPESVMTHGCIVLYRYIDIRIDVSYLTQNIAMHRYMDESFQP